MPDKFRRAALEAITFDICVDNIYTVIGTASAEHIRNVQEVLAGPISARPEIFGSNEKALAFMQNWIRFLEREDTSTITTYWVVKGLVSDEHNQKITSHFGHNGFRHDRVANRADAAIRSPQLTRKIRCAASRKAAIGCACSEFHDPYD